MDITLREAAESFRRMQDRLPSIASAASGLQRAHELHHQRKNLNMEMLDPQAKPVTRNTGNDVNYYLAEIALPKRGQAPYTAECEDIILALGMSFEEGCAFKAIWRRAAAKKLGVMKKNYDGPEYDGEKTAHYGKLMVHADKLAALGHQIVGMTASATGLDPAHVPQHRKD